MHVSSPSTQNMSRKYLSGAENQLERKNLLGLTKQVKPGSDCRCYIHSDLDLCQPER